MLLTIDVGNSQTHFGVHSGKQLKHYFELATSQVTPAGSAGLKKIMLTLRRLCPKTAWQGAIVSSVVPLAIAALSRAIYLGLGFYPMIFTASSPLPIKNKYLPPHSIGTDRLLNAYAALQEFGSPVIVVDFGTAITFDVVAPKNKFLGGAIMPGLRLWQEALQEKTALLPKVKLKPPTRAIGRTTTENMLSGIILGAAGAVEGLCRKLQNELGQKAALVATGGQAKLVLSFAQTPKIHFRPFLTLEGLRLVFQNSQNRKPSIRP
jgi:type III pantothenate kinase